MESDDSRFDKLNYTWFGTTPHKFQNGVKHDEGKDPWHLLPYDVLDQVTKTLKHGAGVYDERNWEKGMNYSRLFSATQRHLSKFWQGLDEDHDSTLHHLDHAIADLLMLRAYTLREIGNDDRPTGEKI